MKRQLFLFIFFFMLLTGRVYAEQLQFQESQLIAARHQLIIDQKSHELANNQLLQFKENSQQSLNYLLQKGISKSVLKHAEIDIISTKSSLDGVIMALDASKEHLSRIKNSIEELSKERRRLEILKSEEPSAKNELTEVERKLALVKSLRFIENQRIDILSMTKASLQESLNVMKTWYDELSTLRKQQSREKSIEQSTEKMKNLQVQFDVWIAKLSELNQEVKRLTQTGGSENDVQKVNLKIIDANENVELTRLDVYLLSIENDIATASESLVNNLSFTRLDRLEQLARKTNQQLDKAEKFVKTKVNFLELTKNEFQKSLQIDNLSVQIPVITDLQKRYMMQSDRIIEMGDKLDKIQLRVKNLLNQQMSTRQELPGFHVDGWVNLFHKSMQIPGLVVQFCKSAFQRMIMYFQTISPTKQIVWMVLGFFYVLSGFWVHHLLKQASRRLSEKRDRFTTNIIYTLLELGRRTLFALYVLGLLLLLSLLTKAHLMMIIYLVIVYVVFKMLIQAVRISLLESDTDAGGEDVRLYYKLKWAFLFGAVLSAVVVMTHQLPVSYEVKTLSNRIYMIFILLVGLFLFNGRHLLPTILEAKLKIRRRYVFHALRLLNYLIPFAFIVSAIIGLFGYVELAWKISKMQGVFLMVLAAYLIVRGLVIDMIDYASELIIQHSKNGWVWTEAFLKPLDKILRVTLVLLAAFSLALLYGLDNNPAFMSYFDQILHKKLFELAGNVITPIVLVKLIIFGLVLYWASRWSREFSIRWWYKRCKDLGLRNSLSIFTQYIVVISGILIGLQLIGMDLRGLTVVTAAFFAGIGFGLKDMANNYFSGMLLLIERPFRKGDIVKVGEFEGEVSHLGMRSTSVRTWDHMEVIVPNADMFTKPFVNWTHQDSIVRSVITINVNRSDNPHMIQKLVLEVLSSHSAVLETPEPAVLMREIDSALVQMEVRYFIVVGPERSRVKTRSEVLFAIWDCFKEHDITPPIEQYDVSLHNGLAKNNALEI